MARTGGDNPIVFMGANGPKIKLKDTAGNSYLELVDSEDFPMHRFDSKGNNAHRGGRRTLTLT